MLNLLRDTGSLPATDVTSKTPPPSEVLASLTDDLVAVGVELNYQLDPAVDELPEAVRQALTRIVQKACTNVVKHSGAGAQCQVEVGVQQVGGRDCAVAEVVNTRGKGSRVTTASGFGLTGLQESVSLLDGSLETGPPADGGWRVWAALPTRVRTKIDQ